jgi:hypothetical protein
MDDEGVAVVSIGIKIAKVVHVTTYRFPHEVARSWAHKRWCAQARADGEAWRAFHTLDPDFASDPCNVRLGLASDGFNHFGNISKSHSIWPVMLVPYNLPRMCMNNLFHFIH